MPRRQTILVSPLVSLLVMGGALAVAQDRGDAPAQQPRPPQTAKRPAPKAQEFPPEAMDELLRQWEGQSAKLETLEVDIYRIDRDMAWGDETHFAGHAAFKSPDLAYVNYRKIKVKSPARPQGSRKRSSFLRRTRAASSIRNRSRPSSAQGTRFGNTAPTRPGSSSGRSTRMHAGKVLNEGPLPFLFRMKAGDAKERYQMALRGQDEKSSLVMILPRMKEDQEVFSTRLGHARSQVSAAHANSSHLARQGKAARFQALQPQGQPGCRPESSSSASSRPSPGRSRSTRSLRTPPQPPTPSETAAEPIPKQPSAPLPVQAASCASESGGTSACGLDV